MLRRLPLVCLGIAASLATAVHAYAQQQPSLGQFTLGTGVHLSQGYYGTSSITEILYVPLVLRFDDSWGAVFVSVPYLSVKGQGDPVAGGVVFDPDGRKQITSSGLGDVAAGLTLPVWRGSEPVPWIDVTAVVKLGTGDPDAGLGTGEIDYSVQADAYQRWGSWNWFITLGYKAPGSPDYQEFQNVGFGAIGLSRTLGEAVSAGLMYGGQQPLTRGADPQGEVTMFGSWILSASDALHGYISWGLTRSSPDLASGITILHRF